MFNSRLATQTDLIRNPEFDFKLKGISNRVTKNKTKYLLVENYLVYQSVDRYFRRIIGVDSGNYIYFWKSMGLSDERLNSNITFSY